MKRITALALAASMLFALIACSPENASAKASAAPAVASDVEPTKGTASAPTAKPTAQPASEPEPLSAKYAEMLKNGSYHYVLTVETTSSTQTVESAGKDGAYCISTSVPEDSVKVLVLDGKGYATRALTGEIREIDPAEMGSFIPVYSTLAFKASSEAGGKTTDTYTCKTMDGGEGEVAFVFEKGKLVEMTTPELTIEGAWPVSDFHDAPPAELFEAPAKTTLTTWDIDEGKYTGTLSGDSYVYAPEDGSYSISPDISPAEITVAFKNGQVELYAAASVSANGAVSGLAAPRSPEYTQTVSGSLPLRQVDAATVRAEGDLTTEGEGLVINWDKNKKFTKWDIEKKDNTYHCSVTVTMVDGVPTAEIVVDGNPSHRTATVPLALGTQISPYAWLGYAELPQNNYFDAVASGCYYREYDYYALGLTVQRVQASDIQNQYEYDGGNNVTLILNGMTYVLNIKNKTYAQRDAIDRWQKTLEMQANNREKGINATGKKFVTRGSEPIPLLSESGDAESYEYYEFLTDSSASGNVLTLRERIYCKGGDVYAIHALVTNGDHTTESTEVITKITDTPDPALFALPADFDQYKPVG